MVSGRAPPESVCAQYFRRVRTEVLGDAPFPPRWPCPSVLGTESPDLPPPRRLLNGSMKPNPRDSRVWVIHDRCLFNLGYCKLISGRMHGTGSHSPYQSKGHDHGYQHANPGLKHEDRCWDFVLHPHDRSDHKRAEFLAYPRSRSAVS
jgi:hypothetical protein